MSIPDVTILPLDAERIALAAEIEGELRDGYTVTYERYDEMGDRERDDMERRLAAEGLTVVEQPGDGYRLAE